MCNKLKYTFLSLMFLLAPAFAQINATENLTNSTLGLSSSIGCPGFGFDPTSLGIQGISFPSFKLGFCSASVKNKDIECFNESIGNYNNGIESYGKQDFISRGLKTNIITENCISNSSSAPFSEARKAGYMPTSRNFNSFRECLKDSTYSTCRSTETKLPSTKERYYDITAKNAKVIAAGRGPIYGESIIAEKNNGQDALSKCASASSEPGCVGIVSAKTFADSSNKMLNVTNKAESGEYQMAIDATDPIFYFYDTSEDSRRALPIQEQREYASASKRAMSIEALMASEFAELASIQKELIQITSTKNTIASTPTLRGNIDCLVSNLKAK